MADEWMPEDVAAKLAQIEQRLGEIEAQLAQLRKGLESFLALIDEDLEDEVSGSMSVRSS